MSITVTTDVFCDGIRADDKACVEWVHGEVGPRSDATGARKAAAYHGWTRRQNATGTMVDLCPTCSGTTGKKDTGGWEVSG